MLFCFFCKYENGIFQTMHVQGSSEEGSQSLEVSASAANGQWPSEVYIGGGEMEGGNFKVLEYTIQGDQWREIVSLVQYFGITIANNQLIIIGGREWEPIKKVWVLDSVSGTWTQPFNAMPTPRSWPSAVGYRRWVEFLQGVWRYWIRLPISGT